MLSLENSVSGRTRGRWRATCHAVRTWSAARPHEYALICGSPVPGYQAPQETIDPPAGPGSLCRRPDPY
jgi:hypothetical protein